MGICHPRNSTQSLVARGKNISNISSSLPVSKRAAAAEAYQRHQTVKAKSSRRQEGVQCLCMGPNALVRRRMRILGESDSTSDTCCFGWQAEEAIRNFLALRQVLQYMRQLRAIYVR